MYAIDSWVFYAVRALVKLGGKRHTSAATCMCDALLMLSCCFFLVRLHSAFDGEQEKFQSSDFETTMFLGTGSFGRVTLVKFKDAARQEKSASCK